MTLIAASHSFGLDVAETIVSFDLDRPSVRDVIATPRRGDTLQYPVIADGRVGWYRLPVGRNVNMHPTLATFVVDGVDCPLPSTRWRDGVIVGCRWGAGGHATFTPSGDVLHCARRDGAWFGFWPTQTWGLLETTIAGNATATKWVEGATEPAFTGAHFAWVQPDGVHVTVAGRSTVFPAVRGTQFDPEVSPDGTRVVWLEIESMLPVRTALHIGELASGKVRTLVAGKDWWQTSNAHWVDARTLVASQMDPGASTRYWAVIAIDATSADVHRMSGPEHGSFLFVTRGLGL